MIRTSTLGSRLRMAAASFILPLVLASLLIGCSGCGGDSSPNGGTDSPKGDTMFLSIGTAPLGGAFAQVGGALAEVLNAAKGENNWNAQAQGTKGSQENIRLLDREKIEFAMSNAAITYFAVRGEGSWDKKYDVRAVMTLAPNVEMFITKQNSGISKLADLKGKSVVVGPAGAGFKMFLEPILAAHGVSYADFTPLHAGQSSAVDMLSDGAAAAAFLGGAVPTGSITQACSTHDIFFVPFEEVSKTELIEKYTFFQPATIAPDKYSDLKEAYHGLNVGSMHVITRADLDEETVYQVTKTLYENRAAVIEKHPAGRAIEKNAPVDTGVQFHPGAIRFYQDIGIWPEGVKSARADPTAAGQ